MELITAKITFIVIGTIYFVSEFQKHKNANVDTYPSILIYLSRLNVYEWVLSLTAFFLIVDVFGTGTVASLLTLVYLWQRGYEFYCTEHLHVVESIDNMCLEKYNSEWTFQIVHDDSGEFVFPMYIFRINVLRDGVFCFYIEHCPIKRVYYVKQALEAEVDHFEKNNKLKK